MTLNRWLSGWTLATALALPCLPGCGGGDSQFVGPGGGPSSGASGSNGSASGTTGTVSGDKGPGSANGASGADSEPRRGSAATGVDNPGPK